MPAKPFMIVVPVKLVDQWIGEIQRIIPGVTVYKYPWRQTGQAYWT